MTVETTYDSGQLRIKLNGELDQHAARTVMDSIGAAIDLRLPRFCVLDFSGVNFMDSSGIAVIIRTKRRVEELDGNFTIEGIRIQAQKVLNAAGLKL
jgi:stage II sporulation protein AA (anti-sigma F factor antagonist)